jgi:hypothetical protein
MVVCARVGPNRRLSIPIELRRELGVEHGGDVLQVSAKAGRARRQQSFANGPRVTTMQVLGTSAVIALIRHEPETMIVAAGWRARRCRW